MTGALPPSPMAIPPGYLGPKEVADPGLLLAENIPAGGFKSITGADDAT